MSAKFTITNTMRHAAASAADGTHPDPRPHPGRSIAPRTDVGCMQDQRRIVFYQRAQAHHELRLQDFKGTRATPAQHLCMIKCLITEGYRRRVLASTSEALEKEETAAAVRQAIAILSACFGGVEEQDITRDGYGEALQQVRRWGLFCQ